MFNRAFAWLLALLALAPTQALAHEGDPSYRSEIGRVPPGVTAEVLNYDDSLELVAERGAETIVLGYEDEPYLRFAGDGAVFVNRHSPAHYLNSDRYADAELPAAVDADAAPQWERVAEQGRYAWHDHRIHWMSEGSLPPQVADQAEEVKVFDWEVPLIVDGERAGVAGTLTWVGEDSGVPIGLAVGTGLGVAASLAFAVFRIRRRHRQGPDSDAGAPTEAW